MAESPQNGNGPMASGNWSHTIFWINVFGTAASAQSQASETRNAG
jgi:hypothetical protein